MLSTGKSFLLASGSIGRYFDLLPYETVSTCGVRIMDDSRSQLGRVLAWMTVLVVGVATTVLALWLIRNPQVGEATPWANILKHPGIILTAAVVAVLPWWVMAVTAIDADRNRANRRDAMAKGPADWLSVMLADRRRRDRR